MPQPFNYSLNMKDPTQSVMQSLQVVNAMDIMRQQEAKKQAALAEKQAYEADFAAMGEKPTSQQIAQLMLKHQKRGAGLKSAYDALGDQEKQAKVGIATRLYAALDTGNTEAAKQLITQEAERYRASGMEEDAKMLELTGQTIDISPEYARRIAGQSLAVVLGPEKFAETFGKLQSDRRAEELHASAKTESEAKANKAAIDSKYAESQAVADLEKKGWDIWKMQKDVEVQKENSRIAAMNAAAAKETNDLKKRELNQKIDDAKLARDEKIRTKAADASSAYTDIDNMLTHLTEIIDTPEDVKAAASGPWDAWTITTQPDVATFQETLNTVDAQSFIAQIGRMGQSIAPMSDGDRIAITKALGQLSLRGGGKRGEVLTKNAKEAQRILTKYRDVIAQKYGVPQPPIDDPMATIRDEDVPAVRNYVEQGR